SATRQWCRVQVAPTERQLLGDSIAADSTKTTCRKQSVERGEQEVWPSLPTYPLSSDTGGRLRHQRVRTARRRAEIAVGDRHHQSWWRASRLPTATGSRAWVSDCQHRKQRVR